MTEQIDKVVDAAANAIRLLVLSPAAAAFVRHHPNQARMAVTAALEAVAVQFEALNQIESDIPEPLRRYVVEPSAASPPVGVIGADEAAQHLRVSRATVYNWIEVGRLIGWRLTRQGLLIPREQIVGPGELVAGIDRVLQVIPEPRAAWRFLDEPSQHFDVPQRPIDALKAGKLQEVITAAQASGESFT